MRPGPLPVKIVSSLPGSAYAPLYPMYPTRLRIVLMLDHSLLLIRGFLGGRVQATIFARLLERATDSKFRKTPPGTQRSSLKETIGTIAFKSGPVRRMSGSKLNWGQSQASSPGRKGGSHDEDVLQYSANQSAIVVEED